jgi:hypothetical protein
MTPDDPDDPESEQAQYGPGGYLPERAAKRARKIVLREEMGLQWPIAAVVAAVIVLAAGLWFVRADSRPPGEPFEAVLDIDEVDPRGAAVLPAADPGTGLVVVRAGGGVRVFRTPTDEVAWCAESGRLEAPGGAVWNTNGRLVGGPGESLEPLPSQVFDGTLYVDETASGVRLPADPAGATPQCSP